MQEFIVYRNPLEAAIWSALQSHYFIVMLVWAVLTVVSFIFVFKVFDKNEKHLPHKLRTLVSNCLFVLCFVIPTVATYLIFY